MHAPPDDKRTHTGTRRAERRRRTSGEDRAGGHKHKNGNDKSREYAESATRITRETRDRTKKKGEKNTSEGTIRKDGENTPARDSSRK